MVNDGFSKGGEIYSAQQPHNNGASNIQHGAAAAAAGRIRPRGDTRSQRGYMCLKVR